MPGTAPATVLGTPPLRAKWKDAKTKAEEAAKKSKETAKLSDLQKKMKDALGPDLEAWPKYYPDWAKLQAKKTALDVTIKNYSEAVKASGLSEAVTKPMSTALKELKIEMDKRLEKAEELLSTDLETALKASKKTIRPIIVFQQDVAKAVSEKAGKTKLKLEKLELEVILADDKVLKNVPVSVDDGLLAEKIRNKASFTTIIDQLVLAFKGVDNLEVKAAQTKLEEAMDKIIEKALERAAEPILELVKVRSDYRMYKIKKGATLTAAVVGVIASTASMAATPFTGGVSTIAGLIGIMKSINTISDEASKLAMSTETFIGKVTGDLHTLYQQYDTASKTVVGLGEMGKTTVNSLVGPFFTTIKNCKGNCDQAGSKNNGLIVKAHDKSQKLGELLKGQELLQRQIGDFEKANKGRLTGPEEQLLKKLSSQVDSSAKPIDAMIKSIQKLNTRAEKNKGALVMLNQAMAQMAAKEPTWSKVGQIIIQVSSSVGFMVAGGVNVPEPFESVKLVAEVAENTGRALESLQTVYETGETLNEMIQKRKK